MAFAQAVSNIFRKALEKGNQLHVRRNAAWLNAAIYTPDGAEASLPVDVLMAAASPDDLVDYWTKARSVAAKGNLRALAAMLFGERDNLVKLAASRK